MAEPVADPAVVAEPPVNREAAVDGPLPAVSPPHHPPDEATAKIAESGDEVLVSTDDDKAPRQQGFQMKALSEEEKAARDKTRAERQRSRKKADAAVKRAKGDMGRRRVLAPPLAHLQSRVCSYRVASMTSIPSCM
jgi:hypothetical protein